MPKIDVIRDGKCPSTSLGESSSMVHIPKRGMLGVRSLQATYARPHQSIEAKVCQSELVSRWYEPDNLYEGSSIGPKRVRTARPKKYVMCGTFGLVIHFTFLKT